MSTRIDIGRNEMQADVSFLDAVDTPLLELHRSNILKLEVDELLAECRLNVNDVSWAGQLRDYVALVSKLLSKIPNTPAMKDGCPFVLRSEKVDSVDMPDGLKVVPTGPYGINCLSKKAGNAHVLPTMDCGIVVPNSYWQRKDYLNHRYLDKRNIILWNIAKFLSCKKFKKHIGKVEWRNFNGNQSTPSVLLTPSGAEKVGKKQKTMQPKFRIQLVMAMESLNWIPVPRMFPNRSNIKDGLATPYYNSILARDAFWVEATELIKEDLEDFPHFRDALLLSKVWCLQRGLLRGHDSFDEMHIAILLTYLYRTRRLSARMAALQIFTVFMKFLAEEWTAGKVFCMPNQGKNETQTIASCDIAKIYAKQAKETPLDSVKGDPSTLIECHEVFSTSGVTLLNTTMLGNFLGTLSPAFCDTIAHQARNTVDCLTTSRSFTSLFMTNARFWSSLDAYFHVPLKHVCWKGGTLWGACMKDFNEVECLSRDLVSILKLALGDRVTDIRLLTTGNGQDSLMAGDADQIPTYDVELPVPHVESFSNAMGMESLVVGLKINIDNCHRVVDRGPPADDLEGVKAFMDLWGDVAELRRFKDGAIVHAVVWSNQEDNEDFPSFEGDDRTQGGIVERIVQHVFGLHFFRKGQEKPHFLLRDMLSLVDGVRTRSSKDPIQRLMANATLAHRNVLNAFDSLSEFLKSNSSVTGSTEGGQSKLGLPIQIDAIEPLSPSLRYSSVFPPVPHPLLGGEGKRAGKVSGEISSPPIQIQIRFGRSSKWPTDLQAMGAAKTAMLAQLANGIESMIRRGYCSGFEGPMVVTPSHLTCGYLGYSWRIMVRADPELYLLRGLRKPTVDAVRLLEVLTKQSVTSSSHHATIHVIHTTHPSAGHVVRLFNQWLATHMLSGIIPFEAVELLVAHVYSDKNNPLDTPGTVVAGFLRTLNLIGTHDWVRNPLVVDPQGILTEDDHSKIRARFDQERGTDLSKGPAMYLLGPYDCRDLLSDESNDGEKINQPTMSDFAIWKPSYTQSTPERVTLFRTAVLAKRSQEFLLQCLSGATSNSWLSAFRESPSALKSYSMLLRIDGDLISDLTFSSTGNELAFKKSIEGEEETIFTRSVRNRYEGLKSLRRKVYRNLENAQPQLVLHDWRPIRQSVDLLRRQLGSYALFFYNELSPEVIAVLWRPPMFEASSFSVINSEFVRPVEDSAWKSDSLVITNVMDLIRHINQATKDMTVNTKVLDEKYLIARSLSEKIDKAGNKRRVEHLSVADSDEMDTSR